MTTATKRELDEVRSDIRELRGDVQGLLKALKSDAQDNGAQVRERISQTVHQAGEQARAAYEHARDASQQCAEKAKDTVQDHPFTSVLAAVGVGVLLGALLRRR